MPQLVEIKARTNIPMRFHLRLDLGDGTERPAEEAVAQVNELLRSLKSGFKLG